jgi:hypothetical protein
MSCWKQSASFAVFHWGRSATLRSGQDQKFSDTAIIGREQRDIVIEKLAALDHRQGAVSRINQCALWRTTTTA